MGNTAGCNGCIYWRHMSFVGKACYWALDNRPLCRPLCRLVPPENCPYKITEKEAKRLSGKINEAEARRLYGEGRSDAMIAAVFDVTPSGVAYWRKSRGLPAHIQIRTAKKEDNIMPLAVPSVNALPAEVQEKVEAVIARKVQERVEAVTVREDPAAGPEGNKVVYLQNEYDPLIYDAFDLATDLLRKEGLQPRMVCRQLWRESEAHIGKLRDYLKVSEDACRRAVELAAIAAAEEIVWRVKQEEGRLVSGTDETADKK